MVEEGLRPSQVMTRHAFENAVMVNAAITGSTNAVVHLLALAGRVGVELTLEDFDCLTAKVPALANLQPSGEYLMEDFFYAGGVPAVMAELRELLHLDHVGVSGQSVADIITGARCWDRRVIAPFAEPFQPAGSGTTVLWGSLAPQGAVIKASAASRELLCHRGRALAFERVEDYLAACDDLHLDVDASTVVVVKGAGPKGYPGFPEVGNPPVPKKLLLAGVTDIVRVSDGRMSGTGYGTCVLHVSPEAAVGGPIALVRTGDWVHLDVANHRLDLEVDEATLADRRAAWSPPAPPSDRGWVRIYTDHVLGAEHGADLDLLVGSSGHAVPRHSH
jgi:dihydroxy-acid dehydratase